METNELPQLIPTIGGSVETTGSGASAILFGKALNSVYRHWWWYWRGRARKNYEWLKKSRNETKSTYSAKYQASTKLEHVVQTRPHYSLYDSPTLAQANIPNARMPCNPIPNLQWQCQWYLRISSHSQREQLENKCYKGRLEINVVRTVGDWAKNE